MALTLSTLLVIAAVALGPPILFAGLVAGAKRYRKEPVWALIVVFLWGMIFAAGISAVLNLTLTDGLASRYLSSDAGRFMLLALVIAPVVEEFTKSLAVPIVKKEVDEAVDGLIYGAVAGLGFAAAENFLYGYAAFVEQGQGAWVLTAVARTFSSTFLHATATGLTGYGIGRALAGRGSWFGVVPWFLAAVLLHSAFNFLATLGAFFGLIGIIPLIILAIWGFTQVRKQIFALSLVPPDTVWHRVGDKRELPTWERVERPKWRPGEEAPRGERARVERRAPGEQGVRRPAREPLWSDK